MMIRAETEIYTDYLITKAVISTLRLITYLLGDSYHSPVNSHFGCVCTILQVANSQHRTGADKVIIQVPCVPLKPTLGA